MCESDADKSQNSLTPSSAQPIRGVALDMDGLLFDTEKLYWQVGDTLLQRRGHRYSAELQQRMMGRIGVSAIEQMVRFHSLSDEPKALLAESDKLYGALLTDQLQEMPGLGEWIGFLQDSGIPFGLATSSQRKFVDKIFAKVTWRDSLAFVLTGDDVSHGKPHPEMYLKAAECLSIDASQMLVLEDSGNGCAAAVAAGAQTVAVPSEHTRSQDFSGSILIADSLLDSRLWDLIR
ncbi:MAG: HAD-IA family hydrolase [Pirellulaceae bacterium]|nr:HAD-IA family hydrolase [Pirellulaceae bacterium]